MADVFEDREELDPWRQRLWNLIEQTPNLDWLLLTKRPHMVSKKVPWGENWPSNVWLGTTVEDQEAALERLPHLELVPARVRFISAEPLLGALDLKPWLGSTIDWVITGGESGPNACAAPPWIEGVMRPFNFGVLAHQPIVGIAPKLELITNKHLTIGARNFAAWAGGRTERIQHT